jgi:general secretion pathway protein A
MTPDPGFLFLTPGHREALSGLTYAILNRKGFVALTGEAGTGKTTLLTTTLRSIPPARASFSYIVNPTLTPAEFLEMALADFGIEKIPESKAQRLILLQQFLLRAHEEERVAVLVVDEAHKLRPEVLEEIRLLTNFETAEGKLLQIVLAGQSELAELLNREELRQLKQRIAVRLYTRPLTTREVEEYVRYRWARAEASGEPPFCPEAMSRIGVWSRGIPRVVNAICDNALLLAYGAGSSSVSATHILEVVADLDLLDGTHLNGAKTKSPASWRSEPQAGASAPIGALARPFRMPTLERYADAKKPSRIKRLFTLGLAGNGNGV